MALLEVSNLVARYGRITALTDVSLTVDEGEIVALIGANGAGKTTTLRAISGLVRPAAGTIRFAGRDVTRLSPSDIVRAGISHSPAEEVDLSDAALATAVVARALEESSR